VRHEKAVKHFWEALISKGCIREGSHKGFYSVNEETFVSEKNLIDGRTELGEAVEWTEEKNYLFKVSEEMKGEI